MEDHYRRRVTKKHLRLVLDTLDVAIGFLVARVEKSLLDHMAAEGNLQAEEGDSVAG